MLKIGIDTGGTFTDLVLYENGSIRVHKVLSTPGNPARAIIKGLVETGALDTYKEITYGSTVATNALLERKGSRVAFITTEGFADLLEIGRQARPDIYDLYVRKTPPLVPHEMCFGVPERVNASGEVEQALGAWEIPALFEEAQSFAVCLLNSYANNRNELEIGCMLGERFASKPLTLSSDILPEYREYERASTTVVNAYVAPLMDRHLSDLEKKMGPGRFRVMQSNGGSVSYAVARVEPVRTMLSGPAGGVLGAFSFARACGYENVITLDMGGTSTDVSLCPGRLLFKNQTTISDVPIKAPIVDIHTVGAGGGSIASLDPAGGLIVGPESAGAEPGPICYNRGGTSVTITDAHLFLGRLAPDHFLGGHMRLEKSMVQEEIEYLARNLGLEGIAAAEGILRIANTKMQRAIMAISVERGYDPRDFVLVAFGGAAGLHCCQLADELGIPRVLIPKDPGALSAYGMLVADVVRNYSATVLGSDNTFSKLSKVAAGLKEKAAADLAREGFLEERLMYYPSLDLRYAHQSFELEIPFCEDFVSAFHREHRARYGYSMPEAEVEVVTLRLKASGITDKPMLSPMPDNGPDPKEAFIKTVETVFDSKMIETPMYQRERLKPGNEVPGPAIVVEYSSTTIIEPGHKARVNRYGGLEIWRT